MNNNLFSKEELRKRVYDLQSGEKPYVDFNQSFVDELLDEMFPDNKRTTIKSSSSVVNEIQGNRFGHFVMEIYE